MAILYPNIFLANIMGPFLASLMFREQKEHPTNKMAREEEEEDKTEEEYEARSLHGCLLF